MTPTNAQMSTRRQPEHAVPHPLLKHLPNLITLLRLVGCVGVAGLFFAQRYVVMLVVYLIIEILDQVDGKLAKGLGLQSTTGMYFDGFADSLTHLTAFACLLSLGLVPAWMYLIFLFREFALLFLRLLGTVQGVLFGGHWPGKAKALVHCVVIVACFIYLATGSALFRPVYWLPWAVAASLLSGAFYFSRYRFVITKAFSQLEAPRKDSHTP